MGKANRVLGVGRVRVRCLGPGRREHTFWSSDPTRERVCGKCRELLREARLSRRAEEGPSEFSVGLEEYHE